MEIGVGQSRSTGGVGPRSTHRCPQCRTEALVLRRRHLSSPGWGEPTLTEYYDCDYCDARYSYAPADGRWKILAH